MQFEDTVFHSAESIDDYRKRLSKRLRKLQKNYKPTQPPKETERHRNIEMLRRDHGESILYCVKHAEVAIREMKAKYGEEKGKQLEQHLDSTKQWAVDLGLLENTTPNFKMPDEQFERLKSQIEKRLENVRSHVVKLADPDQFFSETLEKAEEDCRGQASKFLAPNVQKRYSQLHKTEMIPEKLFLDSMKTASASVPLPTRNQRNDEKAALIWLEKMRAASTAALGFLGTDNKSNIPKGTLTKLNDIATQGSKFVMEVVANRRKNNKTEEVSLQDAWMIHLQLRNETDEQSALDTPLVMRQRPARPTVTRSKILLTPGRKTPPNLLPVFKMKRATLIRPPPSGEGTRLILEFGKAFVMTIYFVPLFVTLTAFAENDPENNIELQHAPWTPFSHGLTTRGDLDVWGAKGDYAALGHVVEERLRDASANATRVLRQIFSNNIKPNANDFETEIREGTALVEFLRLARTTFMPHWEDADP